MTDTDVRPTLAEKNKPQTGQLQLTFAPEISGDQKAQWLGTHKIVGMINRSAGKQVVTTVVLNHETPEEKSANITALKKSELSKEQLFGFTPEEISQIIDKRAIANPYEARKVGDKIRVTFLGGSHWNPDGEAQWILRHGFCESGQEQAKLLEMTVVTPTFEDQTTLELPNGTPQEREKNIAVLAQSGLMRTQLVGFTKDEMFQITDERAATVPDSNVKSGHLNGPVKAADQSLDGGRGRGGDKKASLPASRPEPSSWGSE